MTEETQEQEVQVDPVEQEARSQGWLPKEEYNGEPGKWVSAEVFVARAPLFEKIDELNKKIRALDQNNKAVVQHYEQVREVEYNRALNTLRAERKAALEDQDMDRVEEITEQIDQVKQAAKATIPQQNVQEAPQEFQRWVDQNKWYHTDIELAAVADSFGTQLAQRGVPPAEVLKKVTEHVKRIYPEKFQNPNKQQASAVETKSATSKAAKTIESDMSQEELRIMHKVMRTAGITKEQYLKDYEAIKGA